MADYAADIKKYTSNVNAAAVESIVKFCGIALKGKDSQWVSVTDPAEVKRVVDGFCAKKLGLDAKTAEAAVKAVGEKMKADKTKQRVTFYYLLAAKAGKGGTTALGECLKQYEALEQLISRMLDKAGVKSEFVKLVLTRMPLPTSLLA